MMEFGPENAATEVLPITARVNQMQVPYLIDLLRWRDRMPSLDSEDEETFVFPDDPRGKHVAPSLFAGKPAGKWQRRPRLIQWEVFDAPAQGCGFAFAQSASRLSHRDLASNSNARRFRNISRVSESGGGEAIRSTRGQPS